MGFITIWVIFQASNKQISISVSPRKTQTQLFAKAQPKSGWWRLGQQERAPCWDLPTVCWYQKWVFHRKPTNVPWKSNAWKTFATFLWGFRYFFRSKLAVKLRWGKGHVCLNTLWFPKRVTTTATRIATTVTEEDGLQMCGKLVKGSMAQRHSQNPWRLVFGPMINQD